MQKDHDENRFSKLLQIAKLQTSDAYTPEEIYAMFQDFATQPLTLDDNLTCVYKFLLRVLNDVTITRETKSKIVALILKITIVNFHLWNTPKWKHFYYTIYFKLSDLEISLKQQNMPVDEELKVTCAKLRNTCFFGEDTIQFMNPHDLFRGGSRNSFFDVKTHVLVNFYLVGIRDCLVTFRSRHMVVDKPYEQIKLNLQLIQYNILRPNYLESDRALWIDIWDAYVMVSNIPKCHAILHSGTLPRYCFLPPVKKGTVFDKRWCKVHHKRINPIRKYFYKKTTLPRDIIGLIVLYCV